MSKKFKDKTCVYCCGEGISTTGDHVFAREFFLKSRRANLPQVPACALCNKEKSDLEHYLTAMLPFGGRHNDAPINLETMVPRRLAKNGKLRGRLGQRSSRIWTREESGLYVRTTSLPFDGQRLERLFEFITRGVMWHHWGVLLEADCFVEVHSLTPRGEKLFQRYVAMNAAQRVDASVGDGTFAYMGAQGTDNPGVSTGCLRYTGDCRWLAQLRKTGTLCSACLPGRCAFDSMLSAG